MPFFSGSVGAWLGSGWLDGKGGRSGQVNDEAKEREKEKSVEAREDAREREGGGLRIEWIWIWRWMGVLGCVCVCAVDAIRARLSSAAKDVWLLSLVGLLFCLQRKPLQQSI